MTKPASIPPSLAELKTGSCLCGKVKLRITGVPKSKMMCHCITCQKVSGSVCKTNMFYHKDHVEFIDPDSLIRNYVDTTPDSGDTLDRAFCSVCGTNVRISNEEDLANGYLTVPWGIIDGDKNDDELKPTGQIFMRSCPAWFLGVEGSRKARNQWLDGRDEK